MGIVENDKEEKEKEGGLHIFVNRRKFEEGDGVKPKMTGAEIANLVGVPADNAVIRFDTGSNKSEIGINQIVEIKNGQHFLVTRKVVEGGYMSFERIKREIALLREGRQPAELF